MEDRNIIDRKKKRGGSLQIDFNPAQKRTIEELKYRFKFTNKKDAVKGIVDEFARAIKGGLVDENGKMIIMEEKINARRKT